MVLDMDCAILNLHILLFSQVDGIVNTTTKSLQLCHGAVAKSILAAAGPALQVECSAKAPNGLEFGKIVVTAGHNLRAQFVFHGTCDHWKPTPTASEKVKFFFIVPVHRPNRPADNRQTRDIDVEG